MSEMVERVGRAIAEYQDCDGDDGFRACARDVCSCRKMARVAITAMREPTYEISIVGLGLTMPRAWRAMIDEALK